jgi:hypothetical protein
VIPGVNRAIVALRFGMSRVYRMDQDHVGARSSRAAAFTPPAAAHASSCTSYGRGKMCSWLRSRQWKKRRNIHRVRFSASLNGFLPGHVIQPAVLTRTVCA